MKTVLKVLICAIGLMAGHAWSASPYPSKPIHFIVTYPPGGASDIVARIIGQKLGDMLGQPVVVENRPGAGGNIGTDMVAKAEPDGYTLLIANIGPVAISPGLSAKLPYDPIRDFVPVVQVSSVPIMLVVNPNVPVTSVKELIALTNSRHGGLSYASAGIGSSNHLAMELFKSLAKVDLQHIPYKGGSPAMVDLIAGQVPVAFDTLPVVLPYVKAGKLRAIGTAGSKRVTQLPDVPTVAEAGVAGYEASSWGGIMAPAGTPREIVLRLNEAINRVLQMPDVREHLLIQGIEVVGGTPEEFDTFRKQELDKWVRVVRAANIKAE